jgi:predicted metal-dependent hydrolase
VSIAVEPSACVVLKAPADAATRRLDELVATKAPWILQRLVEVRELESHPSPKEFVAGESYCYLGRHYRLRIERTLGLGKPIAFLRGSFLTVVGTRAYLVEHPRRAIRTAIVAWYRRQAQRRLPERVKVYSDRAGLPTPPCVLVRDQDRRWGSCSSNGDLRLNWRVMMAPMSLVDYVVAHEVSHLLVRDHSRRFWNLLGTILPDFEERRARLRAEGTRFQL